MRILIAPTALKGTYSACQTAQAIREGLEELYPGCYTVDICPLADGGDATLEVLCFQYPEVQRYTIPVMGPLPHQQVMATYGVWRSQQLAVIEAAQAHGMAQLPRDTLAPMAATSYGVGQLLQTVLQKHPHLKTVLIALGGSASTDGGIGALQALGATFYEETLQPLLTPLGGQDLARIYHWEPPRLSDTVQVLLATDVTNPLLGPLGSATTYGPQKGATSEEVRALEMGLAHWSQKAQEQYPHINPQASGMGAAGGLAFGLSLLPNVQVISGFDWLASHLNLERRIASCQGMITAEGRLDETSFQGKVIGNLVKLAAKENLPVSILCAQVASNLSLPTNVFVSSWEALPLEEAMKNPPFALNTALKHISLK